MPELSALREVFDAGALRAVGPPWLARVREAALERVLSAGLPGRRDEEFRDTDLSALWSRPWTRPAGAPPPQDLPRLPDAHRLVFWDGRPVDDGGRQPALPAGVVLTTLRRALAADPVPLARFLTRRPERGGHLLYDLDTAFMGDGAVLSVPAGLVLERPVQIVSASSGQGGATWLRHVVLLGAGAAAELVEDRGGGGGDVHGAVTWIALAAEAELLHSRLVRAGPGDLDLALVHAEQGPASAWHHRSLVRGGALARTELRTTLTGEGASVDLGGLALGRGAEAVEFLTHVEHAAPGTSSRQAFRAVLADRARSVFAGRVRVARDAQRTDADQSSRALLLSEGAGAHHRPQLEILADDVRCTHGAAVGQLSEEALFYLRARGLSEVDARALLLDAFMDAPLLGFPVGAVQEGARALARGWRAGRTS